MMEFEGISVISHGPRLAHLLHLHKNLLPAGNLSVRPRSFEQQKSESLFAFDHLTVKSASSIQLSEKKT